MSAKVYEHRYELILRNRGPKRTGNNAITFSGNDPEKFIKLVAPIVKETLATWAQNSKLEGK